MTSCLTIPEKAQVDDAINTRITELERQFAEESDPTQKEMISLSIDALIAGESKVNDNICPIRR